jgi:hypothetical protein
MRKCKRVTQKDVREYCLDNFGECPRGSSIGIDPGFADNGRRKKYRL